MSIHAHETVEPRPARTGAADWGLLVLRLGLGIIFVAHGGQKLFGWFGGPGLEAATTGFGKMGISAPLAYLAIFTEFFGGVAILIGLLARLASLGLVVSMVVATAKVHWVNGFFLTGARGLGYEFNFALIAMAGALLLTGPGRLALADVESRWFGAGRRAPIAEPGVLENPSIRNRAA